MTGQRDNDTLARKAALRANAIIGVPGAVLETHGGYGELWKRVYSDRDGWVIEKDAKKADALARQRPTWAVYECDATKALAAGLARGVEFAVLDCDPYGSPWPVIEAFFESERAFAKKMVVCVNDGLRSKLSHGGGHTLKNKTSAWLVQEYGVAHVFERYLEAVPRGMERVVKVAGYDIERFTIYSVNQAITHYAAWLTK
jgi:hypothetical protein